MDYEKLYKEALERARTIRFGNPNSATANVVCEEIFPELKENKNDNDKIRKEIVDFVLSGGDIAWLEEQKDIIQH